MGGKAVEIAPESPVIRDTLGWVYYTSGEINRAEKTLLQAVSINNNIPKIHYDLGKVYLKKNAHAEVLKAFKKAVALDADFPERDEAMLHIKQLAQ